MSGPKKKKKNNEKGEKYTFLFFLGMTISGRRRNETVAVGTSTIALVVFLAVISFLSVGVVAPPPPPLPTPPSYPFIPTPGPYPTEQPLGGCFNYEERCDSFDATLQPRCGHCNSTVEPNGVCEYYNPCDDSDPCTIDSALVVVVNSTHPTLWCAHQWSAAPECNHTSDTFCGVTFVYYEAAHMACLDPDYGVIVPNVVDDCTDNTELPCVAASYCDQTTLECVDQMIPDCTPCTIDENCTAYTDFDDTDGAYACGYCDMTEGICASTNPCVIDDECTITFAEDVIVDSITFKTCVTVTDPACNASICKTHRKGVREEDAYNIWCLHHDPDAMIFWDNELLNCSETVPEQCYGPSFCQFISEESHDFMCSAPELIPDCCIYPCPLLGPVPVNETDPDPSCELLHDVVGGDTYTHGPRCRQEDANCDEPTICCDSDYYCSTLDVFDDEAAFRCGMCYGNVCISYDPCVEFQQMHWNDIYDLRCYELSYVTGIEDDGGYPHPYAECVFTPMYGIFPECPATSICTLTSYRGSPPRTLCRSDSISELSIIQTTQVCMPEDACHPQPYCTLPYGECTEEERYPGCCLSESECAPLDSCDIPLCGTFGNFSFNTCEHVARDCGEERCMLDTIRAVEDSELCDPYSEAFFDSNITMNLCASCTGQTFMDALYLINHGYDLDLVMEECISCHAILSGCYNTYLFNNSEFLYCMTQFPCNEDICMDDGSCFWEPITGEDNDLCTYNHTCVAVDGQPIFDYQDVVCVYDSSSEGYHPGPPFEPIGTCHPNNGSCTFFFPYCHDCECNGCYDGNMCTEDICDHSRGCCLHPRIVCGDPENKCETWTCSAFEGCELAWKRDCEDDNPCTFDQCVPATGECAHTVKDCAAELQLPEDNKCIMGRCDASTGACMQIDAKIEDHNACTTDACDPLTGIVSHTQVVCQSNPNAPCLLPICSDAAGGCGFVAMDCDDENECTDDVCNPLTGTCTHTQTAACGCVNGRVDGDMCTLCGCDENAGGCWTEMIVCDDNNMCTDDSCSNVTGRCVYETHDCDCTDDGYLDMGEEGINACLYCGCSETQGGCVTWAVDCDDHDPTTVDVCVPSEGCAHVRRECQDDGDSTTEEVLDPKTGECLHIPIDCDDGLLCTVDSVTINGTCLHARREECFGTDKCMVYGCSEDMGGCMVPMTIDCDDANPCTFDTCISSTGLCSHTGVEMPLLPYIPACTKYECHAERGGWIQVPVDCRDNDACTLDYCDPETAECVHEQRNTCESEEPCHVSTCDANTGECVDVQAPLGDGDPCTVDICVPAQYPPGWEVQHVPLCVQNVSDHCVVSTVCSGGECLDIERNCNDHNPCTIDTCNPATGCVYTKVDCDDELPCTIDYCSSEKGGCVHVPILCDDHDPRTIDTCNPNVPGMCEHNYQPCFDENPCTVDYLDEATGKCIHKQMECKGPHDDLCVTGDCIDGTCFYVRNDCPLEDPCYYAVCDKATGTCSKPIAKDCDDDNLCTSDSCEEGVCVYTENDCVDENPCTIDLCDPDTGLCINPLMDCADGNPCTEDICEEEIGECIHLPRVDCEEATDACHIGFCDVETGRCIYQPVDCDDDDWCTADYCVEGECINIPTECEYVNCTHSHCDPRNGICRYRAVECDDHDPRTIDVCNIATDECEYTLSPCPQLDPCYIYELDKLTGKCTPRPKDCNDHNPCTADVCDDGECLHHEKQCRATDKCHPAHCDINTGQCVVVPIDCDDNNWCTQDYCDAYSGRCVHAQIDDPFPLETDLVHAKRCFVDKCFPGNGEWYSVPVECDDHNACTSDLCLPGVGCEHIPKDCDGENRCMVYGCNKDTAECTEVPLDCDDKIPATIDWCENGKCMHEENECQQNDPCYCNHTSKLDGKCHAEKRDCRDDDACTADSCLRGECIHVRMDCNDNDACTHDYCDSSRGECAHRPVDCDFGDPCVVYSCDHELGCRAVPKNCSDHDACTNDFCIPWKNGKCEHMPLPEIDDGNPCTIDECHRGRVTHTPVVCDDNDPCTVDRCSPEDGGICIFDERICNAIGNCFVGTCVPCEPNDHHDDHHSDDHHNDHSEDHQPREKHEDGHNNNHHQDDHDHDKDKHHHIPKPICVPEEPHVCDRPRDEDHGRLWYECIQVPITYEEEECKISHCDAKTGHKITKNVDDGTSCRKDVPCKSFHCNDGKCVFKGTKPCPGDNKKDKNITPGVIAGIVLGVLGGILLIGLLAGLLYIGKRRRWFVVVQ